MHSFVFKENKLQKFLIQNFPKLKKKHKNFFLRKKNKRKNFLIKKINIKLKK